MSNYTQTTFFTPKDSLPITDPNKTIFGAAYDVEFANISSAFTTKLDSVFSNPSLLSLNITSSAVPVNGLGLPGANTLGIYANSILVAQFAPSGITFNVPFTFSTAGILTAGAFNANGSALPANGIYNPSANVLAFATNTTFAGQVNTTGGLTWGSPTGGDKGAGTINATGIFVNGSAIAAAATPSVTTTATNASAIVVGQTFLIRKGTTTNRNTTTVSAADPDLSFTAIPAGTYRWEAFITFVCTTTNTQSFRYIFSAGGSISPAMMMATSVPGDITSFGGFISSDCIMPAASIVANTNTQICGYGYYVAGAASAFTFAWAQAVSNANNTSVVATNLSWLALTRLA